MSIDLLTKIEYLRRKRIIMKSKNEKLKTICMTIKKIYNSKKTK